MTNERRKAKRCICAASNWHIACGAMAIVLMEQYFDFARKLAGDFVVMERVRGLLAGLSCRSGVTLVAGLLVIRFTSSLGRVARRLAPLSARIQRGRDDLRKRTLRCPL